MKIMQTIETSNEKTPESENKLKPVVFAKGSYGNYYADDEWRQKLLLKAITVTDDPNLWRKMIGVKTMAELHRTLDKLSIRKEYHEALSRSGINFDFIVGGIKESCFAEKEDTRLKAYQTLLKSLGMDKYEETTADSGRNWEEILSAASNKENAIEAPINTIKEITEYEVEQPKIPEFIQKKQQEEAEIGRQLYE